VPDPALDTAILSYYDAGGEAGRLARHPAS
jgi:hypothetical protein